MAVAVFFSVSIAFALSGTTLPCIIMGTVTVNGVPTAGASVTCTGLSSPYTTDSNGQYIISVPANNQTITVTASYGGHSVTSDPFTATATSEQLDLPISAPVTTPTPTPTITATPTATPKPSANASATPTPTPTTTKTPTPTASPKVTATPTPVPSQAPASAPAATPRIVYVTVTVTPEPREIQNNTTVNDLVDLGSAAASTPTPTALPTKTSSPGFEGMFAIAGLAGAALVVMRRKGR